MDLRMMMKMIKCSLCPQSFRVDDDDIELRKARHEDYHSGTQAYVMGRHGRQQRAKNRIRGYVQWTEIENEK